MLFRGEFIRNYSEMRYDDDEDSREKVRLLPNLFNPTANSINEWLKTKAILSFERKTNITGVFVHSPMQKRRRRQIGMREKVIFTVRRYRVS